MNALIMGFIVGALIGLFISATVATEDADSVARETQCGILAPCLAYRPRSAA